MKRYLVAGLLAVGALALSQDAASAHGGCQSIHGKFCGGFNFVVPRVKFCFDSCPSTCGPAPAAPCYDGGPIVAPPAHAWYNYWPHGGHGPAHHAGGGVAPVQPMPAPRMQMQGPQPASYQPMNVAPASYVPSTGAAPYYWYGR